jgi:biotin carboxyl carrier protein
VKIRATIDGEERVIEIPGAGGLLDAVEVQPGAYSVLHEGRSLQVFVEDRGDGRYDVTVDGRRHEIALEDPRRYRRGGRSGGADGPQTVIAPMPGKIVKLLVESGAEVQSGQGLLVVEAMKMQNEIRSPRAGVVKQIHVDESGSVAAGEALITIE